MSILIIISSYILYSGFCFPCCPSGAASSPAGAFKVINIITNIIHHFIIIFLLIKKINTNYNLHIS